MMERDSLTYPNPLSNLYPPHNSFINYIPLGICTPTLCKSLGTHFKVSRGSIFPYLRPFYTSHMPLRVCLHTPPHASTLLPRKLMLFLGSCALHLEKDGNIFKKLEVCFQSKAIALSLTNEPLLGFQLTYPLTQHSILLIP
jgi:hypothetical protein